MFYYKKILNVILNMNVLKNYVISLVTAEDRRLHISNEFSRKNIEFTFFDAINPKNMEFIANKHSIQIKNSNLSDGEICCLLSHVCLWNLIIEKNLPYLAIFEDDIYLGENAEIFLSDNSWIDPKWDILKIEKALGSTLMSLKLDNVEDNRKIGKLKAFYGGTGGYILSQNGAKSLLNYIKKLDVIDHIDQIMFRHYLKEGSLSIYQMTPAICIQDIVLNPKAINFPSSLTWIKKQKIKRSFIQKLFRELFRPIQQLIQLPFKREIKFK